MFESAAHAVLAADGAQGKPDLRVHRAEKRACGNAPDLFIGGHPLEKLLQGEADILVSRARRHDFGHGSHDGINRADKRTRFHEIGRIAVSGHRADVRFVAADLRSHRDRGSELIPAPPRHIHAARADRRIERFGKPLLGADVEIRKRLFRFFHEVRARLFIEPIRHPIADFRVGGLLDAVGV